MTLLRLHTFRPGSVADVVGSVAPRRSAPATVYASRRQRVGRLPQAAPVSPPSSDRRVESVMVPAANRPAGGEGDWHRIVGIVLVRFGQELGQNCELRKLEDGFVSVAPVAKAGHLQMKPIQERLQQALADYLGSPVQLRIELADNEVDTPAATAGGSVRRTGAGGSAIARDGFVRDAIDTLGDSIVESSIKPIA